MTTGVPFFDIYLKSLINSGKKQSISRKITTSATPSGYKLSRSIAHSVLPATRGSAISAISTTNNNNTDAACFRLPPELWLFILQLLPLSQVTELNLVCRRLFCIVRYKSGFWFHIQKIIFPGVLDPMPMLGGPTPLDNLTKIEWMAYKKVKESFGLACDVCYQGRSMSAIKHGSSAVLAVLSPYITRPPLPPSPSPPHQSTTTTTTINTRKQYIYLCLPCRHRHYFIYPEPEPEFANYPQQQQLLLTLEEASQKYLLPRIPHAKHSRIWEIDALRFGRRIHGGDVGIKAERWRVANGGAITVVLPTG